MLYWKHICCDVAGVEGSLDFDKMAHTELLKSDVAKDRISVKPRTRKATRQSRKKREVRHASFRRGSGVNLFKANSVSDIV